MNQREFSIRNQDIEKMAETHTLEEIAAKHNMKPARVRIILRNYKKKACRLSKADSGKKALAIIEQLNAGVKQIEIAKNLGVSRQYVCQVRARELARQENKRLEDEMRKQLNA